MVLTNGNKERIIQTSDQPTEIKKIFEKKLVNGFSSLSLDERQLLMQSIRKLPHEDRKKMDEYCNDEVSNKLYVHPNTDGGTNENLDKKLKAMIPNNEFKPKIENIKYF